MSNELTPQQKYLKFYKSPHYWINAIEVECIEDFTHKLREPNIMALGKKGDIRKFDANFYDTIRSAKRHYGFDYLKYYKPLFKPQEGDQFIKHLEAAVSAACFGEYITLETSSKWEIVFQIDRLDGSVSIRLKDLAVTTSDGTCFDTAGYVDTLRKLGYYL
jgi:hypothetical protein